MQLKRVVLLFFCQEIECRVGRVRGGASTVVVAVVPTTLVIAALFCVRCLGANHALLVRDGWVGYDAHRLRCVSTCGHVSMDALPRTFRHYTWYICLQTNRGGVVDAQLIDG